MSISIGEALKNVPVPNVIGPAKGGPPPAQNNVVATTPDNRFFLMIRWLPAAQRYGTQTSTYRGDQYIKDDLSRQFTSLITLLLKNERKGALLLLFDKTIPKNQPEYTIVKIHKGVVEVNRLNEYPALLKDYPLPAFLK